MAFGRFDRHSGPQPFSDINVTPLVDVMLVLVVIFIITAPLLTSSIQLNLPQTAAAQPGTPPPQAVTLVIDKASQLFLNDQPVSADELSRQLTQAATRSPDTEVQLRADASVPYGRVVEIMGRAHQAGLTRIGFVAEPAPSATSAVR